MGDLALTSPLARLIQSMVSTFLMWNQNQELETSFHSSHGNPTLKSSSMKENLYQDGIRVGKPTLAVTRCLSQSKLFPSSMEGREWKSLSCVKAQACNFVD